ncbi:uncharacterized protein DEA37_0001214 [Paragonimus westermani]|uniref:tRNA-intron lyase n=1 Tax=Paragonimus westermani TaxID=34504 RepID=A0A5J4NQS6_9TREM|nr:uncharacterized protein DEA37_0001214 [Paragonimus westermani]
MFRFFDYISFFYRAVLMQHSEDTEQGISIQPNDHPWCVYLTPFGEFLVWKAEGNVLVQMPSDYTPLEFFLHQEIFQTKRRLELTGLYGQLLAGLPVHKRRHHTESDKDLNEESVDKVHVSVRSRRKAVRLAKKQNQSTTAAIADGDDRSDTLAAYDSDCDEMLTLDRLFQLYSPQTTKPLVSSNSHTTFDSYFEDPVGRHLPRPTPQEWIRSDEIEHIPVPGLIKEKGVSEIARWLFQQFRLLGSHNSSSTDGNESSNLENETRRILRCQVFEDLWCKGFYVTTSTAKMGGDFLLYQGDPLLFHASHIVSICNPTAPMLPKRLTAQLRVANGIRKILVLACVSDSSTLSPLTNSPSLVYTSLKWTNWLICDTRSFVP